MSQPTRPRTATSGPARVPALGAMPTPRTAAMTPRVATPDASPTQMDSRFVADTLRNNQAMQQELAALRQMLGQMKALKAELADERRTSQALEAEAASLRTEYDAVDKKLREERNAKEEALAKAATAAAVASGAEAVVDKERQRADAAVAELSAARQELADAQASAAEARDEAARLREELQRKEADFAALREQTGREIEAAAADVEAVSKRQTEALQAEIARVRDEADAAARATAQKHGDDITELQQALAERDAALAAIHGVQRRDRGMQSSVVLSTSTASGSEPVPASPRTIAGASRGFSELEQAYREFLLVCDEFNCAVNDPGQDALVANAAVTESNRALGLLLERVDGVVARSGSAPTSALRQFADCLQHAIVTTTTIHAYAGQGLVLEAELGDEAFNDHESTMLIALRRVVRNQLREST
eukprot:CAMPEP_0174858538 /NCGR_PEP_ID=MMETSP1114-20130205/42993_1 /TAXON_ID=312471 /ORGANISM="Neobodo designis, Strain CCAP 1951/1" /LENGTH=422 /DNA_ID=CAMNT_0016093445 /DNA_START=35 /DNA_END=1300 /DNA_ORIENTATION=+